MSSKILMEPNGELLTFKRLGHRGKSLYVVMRHDQDFDSLIGRKVMPYKGFRAMPIERMPKDLVSAARNYGRPRS